MTITVESNAPIVFNDTINQSGGVLAPTSGGAGVIATASSFAGRTLKQFVRTPQLIALGAVVDDVPAHLPLRIRRGD